MCLTSYTSPQGQIHLVGGRKDMCDEMSMNPTEVSRMIDFLRAIGLDEKTINNCIQYIATGINLPGKPQINQ